MTDDARTLVTNTVVTGEKAQVNKHSISYDSTVDGAQTVTFTPMPTEVDDGASTTISMEAKALTASYYAKATGIAINEVRKSSVKVGTTKTEGTGTLTISNQKQMLLSRLSLHSFSTRQTKPTLTEPYMNRCITVMLVLVLPACMN